jgi:hypothetical protein
MHRDAQGCAMMREDAHGCADSDFFWMIVITKGENSKFKQHGALR